MANIASKTKLLSIDRKFVVTANGVTVPVWTVQVEFQFGEFPDTQVINDPTHLLPAPPAVAVLPAPSPSGGEGSPLNQLFRVLN